jgi:hypothetical protein
LAAVLALSMPLMAQNPAPGTKSAGSGESRAGDLPQGFKQVGLKVDGVDREALVYAPAAAAVTNAPVVFVFHGHGGSAQQAARSFAMSREWPEAISVYMQGLNTPGRLTDPEGKKPGWQHGAGAQGDRDLKFFREHPPTQQR